MFSLRFCADMNVTHKSDMLSTYVTTWGGVAVWIRVLSPVRNLERSWVPECLLIWVWYGRTIATWQDIDTLGVRHSKQAYWSCPSLAQSFSKSFEQRFAGFVTFDKSFLTHQCMIYMRIHQFGLQYLDVELKCVWQRPEMLQRCEIPPKNLCHLLKILTHQ